MVRHKYYSLRRGKNIHIAIEQDLHKTVLACGRWRFTHLLMKQTKPKDETMFCKKCLSKT